MKLKDYLEEHGTTMAHVARKAGVAIPTIRNIIKEKDMRFSVILKVRDATKGLVSFEDMLPKKYLDYYVKKEGRKNKKQDRQNKKDN